MADEETDPVNFLEKHVASKLISQEVAEKLQESGFSTGECFLALPDELSELQKMFKTDKALGKPGILCAIRVIRQSLASENTPVSATPASKSPVDEACRSLEKDIANFEALARADPQSVDSKSAEIFPNWFSSPATRPPESSSSGAKPEKLDFLKVNQLAWAQALSLLRANDVEGATKFCEMMRFVAQKGASFGYDAQVRLLSQIRAESAELKLPINDNNLLLSSALVVLSAPPPSINSQSNRPRTGARCRNFNEERCSLSASECRYTHRCFKCNKGHPAAKCSQQGENSSGGQGAARKP